MKKFTTLLVTVLTAAALFTGCGGGAPSQKAADVPAASTAAIDDATVAQATVARTDTALDVYTNPGDVTPELTLDATTRFGSPRALLVRDTSTDGAWLQVIVPVRPNDRTGWIRSSEVSLTSFDQLIRVDTAGRTLDVIENGETVLSVPAAVGAEDARTPTGLFSVVDKLQNPDPTGAYGPFALGLSSHSDTYQEFAGGDGQIGIHGTDEPDSIGRAASHGCIRVSNDVVTELNDRIRLGAPVLVV